MYKLITKKTLAVIMSMTLLMLLSSTAVWAQEGDDNAQDETANIHQAPKYPVVVDGVRYAPEEITRFNGEPLILFANEQVEKEGVIYAFTTEEKAKKHADSLKNMIAPNISVIPQFSHGTRTALIYKNINYSSGIASGNCGESWNIGQADNQASSMRAAHCAAGYTKLYDNFNLGGSSLWITMGFDVADLRVYGWNDRASSFKVDL